MILSSSMDQGPLSSASLIKRVAIGATLVVLIGFMFASFETIDAGERGVVTHWGRVDRVLDEGFHVVNPFSEDVHVLNVQVQLLVTESDASSKDLQEVTSTVELNYHIDPSAVDRLYQEIGKRFESVVIKPAIQESVKSGTAMFTAEEQINKRVEVKSAIKQDLTTRLAKFDIIVDQFNITDLSFSVEFDKAIEQKQVAEQMALTAENDLRRVEFEQQQEIEKAKASAEKSRLEVEALKMGSGELIKLRKAEAMLAFAKAYQGGVPHIMVMLGDGFPFMD